jgi:hypothetical protein
MSGATRARRALTLLSFGGFLAACSAAPAPAPAWLSPDRREQTLQLERQLRGFDVAMLEVGHRYAELYWAGEDENWSAAAYQLQKIRLAIELGLERRPKRAASAQAFLAGPLAAMDAAVAARGAALFDARFRDLTAGCNACHATEQVAYFGVRPPEVRTSPVHGAAPARED